MKSSWIIGVVAALAITGCQTTGTQGVNSSTSQFKVAKESYSLFFDQKTTLSNLLQQKTSRTHPFSMRNNAHSLTPTKLKMPN